MLPAQLDRRTLLRSGGMAVGSLALAGGWTLPANATPPTPPLTAGLGTELAGSVVAWVVLDFDRGATLRLMQLDGGRPGAELAAHALPPVAPTTAADAANQLAIATVAQAWQAPPGTCAIEHSRITHPASGRSIGYAIWVDFA